MELLVIRPADALPQPRQLDALVLAMMIEGSSRRSPWLHLDLLKGSHPHMHSVLCREREEEWTGGELPGNSAPAATRPSQGTTITGTDLSQRFQRQGRSCAQHFSWRWFSWWARKRLTR